MMQIADKDHDGFVYPAVAVIVVVEDDGDEKRIWRHAWIKVWLFKLKSDNFFCKKCRTEMLLPDQKRYITDKRFYILTFKQS